MSLPGLQPFQQRVTIAQPALGAEWSMSVPANPGQHLPGLSGIVGPLWVRLSSARCVLSTSSTVIARWPGAQFADAAANKLGAISATVGPPGGGVINGMTQETLYMRSFCWDSVGWPSIPGDTVGINWAAVIFPPGYTFGSSTPGLQTGDRYSAIELWLECWSDPTGVGPIWDGGTVQTF